MIAAAALSYLKGGLCVLPADPQTKFTTLRSWKAFQKCLPSQRQVAGWFEAAPGICIIAGGVSGNLEAMDFDCKAEAYEPWAKLVEIQAPGLLSRLVIETSQSGGRHVIYRVAGDAPRSAKLASKLVVLEDSEVTHSPDGAPRATLAGKSYVPRKVDGHWRIEPCLIETKGEGGLLLCAPTGGYELIQGDLASVPVITAAQREVLVSAARSLDEAKVAPAVSPIAAAVAGRPGDEFNDRGDVRELLVSHGWTAISGGDNEHWRRPGKDRGTSATLKDRVFYCFTSSAPPLEADKAYGPFALYAALEHGGDWAAAAAALRSQGYGAEPSEAGVDLSAFGPADEDPDEPAPLDGPQDPGPVPQELLAVPGFVQMVMDHCLATAPHPNRVMAFCGALALQATLAGRKVRDETNSRTSLYILGLANSGVGKDHPRKVNQDILLEAGMHGVFANTFASGEGIEDRMLLHPATLFQTDEIDALLASIGTSKEARFEGIMNILLRMYTSADNAYVMRAKAGKTGSAVIDQPCLCLFGTAIPRNFYQALSVKMLDNGFFARMIVLDAGPRSRLQRARATAPPQQVLDIARWWASYRPGTGNLENWHPQPRIIEYSDEAGRIILEYGEQCDRQYALAEDRSDTVAMAIWARADEKARRLALIHACSANHLEPLIGKQAAQWACRLVDHLTRRMLFMASEHVSESDFDADCKKLMRLLREWQASRGDAWMPFWRLGRKLPWPAKRHDEVRTALVDQKKILFRESVTSGRRKREYRLR